LIFHTCVVEYAYPPKVRKPIYLQSSSVFTAFPAPLLHRLWPRHRGPPLMTPGGGRHPEELCERSAAVQGCWGAAAARQRRQLLAVRQRARVCGTRAGRPRHHVLPLVEILQGAMLVSRSRCLPIRPARCSRVRRPTVVLVPALKLAMLPVARSVLPLYIVINFPFCCLAFIPSACFPCGSGSAPAGQGRRWAQGQDLALHHGPPAQHAVLPLLWSPLKVLLAPLFRPSRRGLRTPRSSFGPSRRLTLLSNPLFLP